MQLKLTFSFQFLVSKLFAKDEFLLSKEGESFGIAQVPSASSQVQVISAQVKSTPVLVSKLFAKAVFLFSLITEIVILSETNIFYAYNLSLIFFSSGVVVNQLLF